MAKKFISWVRLSSLLRKEFRQMFRDKSTLIVGIVLPIVLLILFGYGMSFDVMNQKVIVVKDQPSPVTNDIYMSMKLSPYFSPRYVNSWQEAEKEFIAGKADGIVRVRHDTDDATSVQIIVNGCDANTSRMMENYIQGAISLDYSYNITTEGFLATPTSAGGATAITRIWYNPEVESRFFLIPGVLVLIMTIIGGMLTALVVAREWERGTYEALISTDVTRWEILVAKIIPAFCLGFIGMLICLVSGTLIFGVPLRGSVWLILFSSCMYLVVSLCIGLTISSIVRSQFLSSQLVLVTCFLPTLMLSGYMFDLNSTPYWAQLISVFFPATWFVELILSLFLVGNVKLIIVRDLLMLAFFAVILMCAAAKNVKKSLE